MKISQPTSRDATSSDARSVVSKSTENAKRPRLMNSGHLMISLGSLLQQDNGGLHTVVVIELGDGLVTIQYKQLACILIERACCLVEIPRRILRRRLFK